MEQIKQETLPTVTTTTQPFFRLNNPWLWLGGAVALGLVLKNKGGRAAEHNPRIFSWAPAAKNPVGPCGFGGVSSRENPMFGELSIQDGNEKVGRGKVWCFSLPRGKPAETGGTCICATRWCSAACYGKGGQYGMMSKHFKDPALTRWYGGNFTVARKTIGDPDYFASRMLAALAKLEEKKHTRLMRVHVVGDFFHPDYVRAWVKIAKAAAKRGWHFYSYTRTWQIKKPAWQSALKELKSQPNYNLIASTDPSTGPCPAGWQECGIDVTYQKKSVMCKVYADTAPDCYTCGLCHKKHQPSIYIPAHSLTRLGKQVHEETTALRKQKYGFNPLNNVVGYYNSNKCIIKINGKEVFRTNNDKGVNLKTWSDYCYATTKRIGRENYTNYIQVEHLEDDD